ncbi:hypothetical protein HY640_02195 [Candidatus Woesearchaeota archaeon]|nr:hypothetical protein [Candidatus Woesearchaeota archaeon]
MKKAVAAITALLLSITPAHAHCPLCTVGVGAAAVTARYFGVNAAVLGVFIGAFGVSTGLWMALKAKKLIPFQTPVIVALSFLLTVIPLMGIMPETIYTPLLVAGEPGTALNKVYWLNTMMLGAVIGAAVSTAAYILHISIKKAKGKVLFPYQGVALTLASLLLAGGAMQLLLSGG